MSKVKAIPLEQIRKDGDTQPRAGLHEDAVLDYVEAYRSGVKMPPVVVFFDGESYWLADGFHRWHAALDAGLDRLPCVVHEGTLEDARWYSYAANRTHGLRRTNADKRRAVKAALLHPRGVALSDGQIAEHIGVSDRMVAKYRDELTPKVSESPERTGRDGRTIDTSKIGKKRSRKADQPATDTQDKQEEEPLELPDEKPIDKLEPRIDAPPAAGTPAIDAPADDDAPTDALAPGTGNIPEPSADLTIEEIVAGRSDIDWEKKVIRRGVADRFALTIGRLAHAVNQPSFYVSQLYMRQAINELHDAYLKHFYGKEDSDA